MQPEQQQDGAEDEAQRLGEPDPGLGARLDLDAAGRDQRQRGRGERGLDEEQAAGRGGEAAGLAPGGDFAQVPGTGCLAAAAGGA